jgi:hypothetical protein
VALATGAYQILVAQDRWSLFGVLIGTAAFGAVKEWWDDRDERKKKGKHDGH